MYCHKCGAGNQTAKAYCKSCGEWLPDLNAQTRNTFGGETPQQIVSTNLFMSAISTLAALFSGLALYITYLPGGDAKWSVYIAGAFCLCIAGWQASSFFVTLRLRQRLKNNRAGIVRQGAFAGIASLGRRLWLDRVSQRQHHRHRLPNRWPSTRVGEVEIIHLAHLTASPII